MTERIGGPSSPSSPSDKKKIPNSERFKKEVERIEKPSEVDERQKKNRFVRAEDDKKEKQLPPPPLKSYIRGAPAVGTRAAENVPESPNFYKQVDLHEKNIAPERDRTQEAPATIRKKEEKQKEKEGVQIEKKEKESIFSPFAIPQGKKTALEKKPILVSKEEAEEELQDIPSKKKMEFEKAPVKPAKKEEKTENLILPPVKEKKEIAAPKPLPKFEKRVEMGKKEIAPPEKKEEKIKKRDEEKSKTPQTKKEALPQTKEAIPLLKELPPAVQAAASASASAVAPYIHAESLPLFERMVGTMIQMSKTGLETCEVLLTSPAFVGSKYYGTKITFEKYDTSPDSFNIHLTGSDEAITTFNEHLGGLLQAFDKGKFSFKVGRLWAEYETERPLFKRKSPIEKTEE